VDDVERLTGGGVNEVVRVGGTVRRPTGPHSPRVHDVLRRLAPLDGVPRVHGVDGDREVLDFLPGNVPGALVGAAASESALGSAARFLRRFHDATALFASDLPHDGWMFPAGDPVEVVVHGDYAPYNCVLEGERVVGLVDFDTARPGPRIVDVATGAYRWVPLSAACPEEFSPEPAEQARRLAAFCAAYGLDAAGRAVLLDAVVAELVRLVEFLRAQAAAGSAAFAAHVAEGHDQHYLADVDHVARHRSLFQDALDG
jgi:Ser/Thr protein kinase RdoA (MazF antagonist)